MASRRSLISRLRRRAIALPAMAAAGLVAVYAAAGFLLAPYLLEREVPRALKERTQSVARFERIRFNPFLFRLEATGFSLASEDGRPLFAFDRLLVDFELSSLLRWAWTFAEIRLEGPRIDLDIDEKGALNLATFVDRLRGDAPAGAEPEQRSLPRMLLLEVALNAGRVTITDRSGTRPARASLDAMAFELKDLSTLPDQSGGYALTARLASGGSVTWRGDLVLQPLVAQGEIDVRGVKLGTLWRFVRDEVLTEEPQGEIDAGLRYRFAHAAGVPDLKVDALALRANDVSLTARGAGSPLGTLSEVSLAGGSFDLAQRRLAFSELALRRGGVTVAFDADGVPNWRKAFAIGHGERAPAAPDSAGAAAGEPWRLAIDKVRIEEISVAYDDAGRASPPQARAQRVDLEFGLSAELGKAAGIVLDGISTRIAGLKFADMRTGDTLLALESLHLDGGRFDLAQRMAAFRSLGLQQGTLAVVVGADGALNWAAALASASAAPAVPPEDDATAWAFSIDSVRVEDLALRYADSSRVQPVALEVGRSDLELAVKAEIGARTSFAADAPSIRLAKISLARLGERDSLIALDAAALEGGRFDLAGNSAAARSLKLSGGATTLSRDAAGALNLAGAFAGRRAPPPKSPQQPFVVSIAQIALDRHRVAYRDHTTEPAIGYDLEQVQARLNDVSTEGRKPVRFRFAARLKQGGDAKVQGTYSMRRGRADGRVEAARLGLAPLAPLLERHVALRFATGTASASGRFNWVAGGENAGIGYSGSAAIEDFRLDEPGGAPFLGWKAVAATDVEFVSGAPRLAIGELRVVEPAAKLVINRDRSVNLAAVMKPSSAPAASDAAGDGPAAAKFDVAIDRVRVERGELDFADLSLVLPFSTRIRELSGSVTGLATGATARAGVSLEGKVEDYGLGRIDGTVNAFAPKTHTDLAVAFRNVMMSPLTPYSVTFAGRRIASGRLSLDLRYRIENSRLQGDNKVLLEKFTLGERVESKSALNLPLDLAIALLTDAEGRIDIAVPVRGDVDKPDFSYGHLVWQAIRTVIANVVTAPFRALGAAFGGKEAAPSIAFEAGSARLLPPEREKLAELARTLKTRPGLKLLVHGRHDAERDGDALRAAAARRALAELQGVRLGPDEDPGPVAYDNAKVQQALEALLRERGGANTVTAFVAEFEKARGREATRVNPVLALVGRGSSDRELYEAMFGRIVELQPLPDSALPELARSRAAAIAQYVMAATDLPAQRVQIGKPGPGDEARAGATLSLGVLEPAR